MKNTTGKRTASGTAPAAAPGTSTRANGESKRQRVNGTLHNDTNKSTNKCENKQDDTVRYPFELSETDKSRKDSVKCGEHALQWLLKPLKTEEFFATTFEKEHKLLRKKTNEQNKFECLLNLNDIKRVICDSNKLEYGNDIDVTRYTVDTGKKSYNLDTGKLVSQEAWKEFNQHGSSIRFLRPQVHFDPIYKLCSYIEELLECIVGANIYLTPLNYQGFAPHFDDIDAFICQVAGCKRWKVYQHFEDGCNDLPRNSSIDFHKKHDLSGNKLLLDTVLHPGDMLYLPRGTIHEAKCVSSSPANNNHPTNDDDDKYSLHVTISMFQKWTWADLLESSVLSAVRSAANQDKTLRRTLPLRFGKFAGAQCSESNPKLRDWFHSKVGSMVSRLAKHYPTDTAADELMKKFMHERLPPACIKRNRQPSNVKLTQASKVRMVCAGAARIIIDEDGPTQGLPRIISCVHNSKSRQSLNCEDETSVSCLADEAQAVDFVIKAYPQHVKVSDVPLPDKQDRIDLLLGLIDMGIVESS